MKKVIYVYRRKDSEENTYKIGKADQRANQTEDITIDEIGSVRISEQLTAATYGEFEVINTFDISHVESSTAVEHAIHKGIELAGFDRLTRQIEGKKGTTEWFDFDDANEGEVLELVKTLVEKYSGVSGLSTYKPRGYQSHVKTQIIDAIDNGGKIIGAELAARFGKTLWTLDLFKTLTEERGYQYLILPAYVLTAHASFQKELRSFADFDDMVFITDKDDNFEKKIADNADKKLVIATSLHTPEDSLEKYVAIANLDNNKKIAFIDEADFGAHTESSKLRLDILDVPTKVIMTGTAIERALAGYDVDAIVKWSYFDMLLLKDGNHPMLDTLPTKERQAAIDSCAAIVRPKLFKMSMPNAADIQESLPDVLQTKWSKLLEDVDKSNMILTMIIKAMFKNDNSDIMELTSLQLGSVTPANVTMIFGAFKNKIQHNKFAKLTSVALGDDFEVLTVNGDETSNRQAEEDVKIAVAKAKRAGKKVVIVSKDMASRSFSISEIDTVFLMYDRGLLSQTVQKSSRAFTPGNTYTGEDKTEGVIVSLSLDNNRMEVDPIDLYVIAEANRINNEEESLQDSIRRICNSANIFQNDLTFGAINIEADKYAEQMLKQSSVLKDIIATMSLEQINPNDFMDAILANRSTNPNRRDVDNVSVNTSAVRTAITDREETEREPITPNEEKQFIKNVIFFTNNIIALKEISNYTASTIKSLLSNISEKGLEYEVEEFYGIRYASIEKLVETKALPIRLLNTLLENHQVEVLEF